MNSPTSHTPAPSNETSPSTPSTDLVLDFESDEPLPACPLRNEGSETCDACQ